MNTIEEWKKDFKEYVNGLSLPRDDYKGIMEYIDGVPTVKPRIEYGTDGQPYILSITNGIEERPKGEWIKWNFKTFGAMGDWEYKCSNCEKVYGGEYNFCPNCGADMRKGGTK